MCNLYSITTNQAAIIALFRKVNRYVGNLAPMAGVFPDYPAPVICIELKALDRARIQMIYVPASRDGASQVTAFLRGALCDGAPPEACLKGAKR